MNKFDAKKIMPRYRAISLVMIILAVCVVGKSLYIMTAKRDYWMKVAERQKRCVLSTLSSTTSNQNF